MLRTCASTTSGTSTRSPLSAAAALSGATSERRGVQSKGKGCKKVDIA
ncbi:MAG: hypothetical protein HYU84_07675 [Chloroflexi bacterium]|nr:hypothetical protein [Chloroflexota bacterium]